MEKNASCNSVYSSKKNWKQLNALYWGSDEAYCGKSTS